MLLKIKTLISFSLFFLCSYPLFAKHRFYYEGAGEIKLHHLKNSKKIQIRYKENDGTYIPQNIAKISAVYGIGKEDTGTIISLRLLELLSYIQDHFNGSFIEILSGFRSSSLNLSLRGQGKMAAQSSMHIEAAALDFKIEKIQILKLKEFLMSLNCCGVGYYGSQHV